MLAQVSCGEAPRPDGDIVSLSPVVTEILYELGAGERIMANSKFCNYPPAARDKLKVADFHNVNEEEILRLRPALIIDTDSKAHQKMWQRMEDVGIRVVHYPIDTIDQIPAAYVGIGEAVGKAALGRELAQKFEDDRAALKARYAEVAHRPRVLFLTGYVQHESAGRGTFVDDLIKDVGGTNVVEAENWPTSTDLEKLRADPPDFILVSINGSEITPAKIAEIQNQRALKQLGAPIHIVNGDEVCRPTPRIIAGWAKIGAILHPEVETN